MILILKSEQIIDYIFNITAESYLSHLLFLWHIHSLKLISIFNYLFSPITIFFNP